MRVSDQKIRSGFFWLPADPENRLPGTLEISDGGRIELKVLGAIGGRLHLFDDLRFIPRIVGIVEKYGAVTLDRCFFTSRTFEGNGIAHGRIFVHQAFLGVLMSEGEPVRFNEFRFSVEGLDEWLHVSGIVTDGTASKISVSYTRPNDIVLKLPGGARLTFSHSWNLAPAFNRVGITQKASIRVAADEPLSFDDSVFIAHQLTHFLCLAIDKTVAIDAFSAMVMATEGGSGPEKPTEVKVLYQSIPFTERDPKTDNFRMLFDYAQIATTAEEKIGRWFAAYELFRPTLALYFSARTGAHKYLDSKFLSLVHALETFHRRTSDERLMDDCRYLKLVNELTEACPEEHKKWLAQRLAYGNELSLGKRLLLLAKPFEAQLGGKKRCSALIRKIADTRNYLTHYDKKLEGKAATGNELYGLCVVAEAIVQLHVLKQVSFTDAEIDAIVTKSDALRAKLRGEAN